MNVTLFTAISTIYIVVIYLNETHGMISWIVGLCLFYIKNSLGIFNITHVSLSCWQRYRKTLGKIHAKEDRVLDLDDVLKYADANADGKIDFDEWRQDLIKWSISINSQNYHAENTSNQSL